MDVIEYGYDSMDQLVSFLKSAKPDCSPPRDKQRNLDVLLRRHGERKALRRRRQAVVAGLAFLLVPALFLTDVPSEVLELIELNGVAGLGRVFELGQSNLKFNVLGDHTDEEILELGQQMMAGEGRPVKATGFLLAGRPFWSVVRVYQALGGEQEMIGRSKDPACDLHEDLMDFVLNEWDGHLADIEAGSIPRVGTEMVTLDGNLFEMGVWDIHHPVHGVIKYYAGDIVTGDKAADAVEERSFGSVKAGYR